MRTPANSMSGRTSMRGTSTPWYSFSNPSSLSLASSRSVSRSVACGSFQAYRVAASTSSRTFCLTAAIRYCFFCGAVSCVPGAFSDSSDGPGAFSSAFSSAGLPYSCSRS